MKSIKNIFKALFVSVIFCTNINAQQEQSFQQADLINKEWFIEGGNYSLSVKEVMSETEIISTKYSGGEAFLVQRYEYYLSETIVSVFDVSKVGQSTEGKYVVTRYIGNNEHTSERVSGNGNNGSESNRIYIHKILYVSADTYKSIYVPSVGEFVSDGGATTWHTADWEDPNDHDGMYDEGDSGIHGSYQIP